MDSNFKKAIILDNYEKPFNRGLLKDESYLSINKNSSSCIDNFNIELKIEDGIIKDIRFDGEACAISTSALSISIKKLIGKTKEEAYKLINNYENMIDEKEYDEELLEELNAFEDIYKQPSRKKCASIGIEGIKDLLNKE